MTSFYRAFFALAALVVASASADAQIRASLLIQTSPAIAAPGVRLDYGFVVERDESAPSRGAQAVDAGCAAGETQPRPEPPYAPQAATNFLRVFREDLERQTISTDQSVPVTARVARDVYDSLTAEGVGDDLSRVTDEWAERRLRRPPTIRLAAGRELRVVVTQDLVLPTGRA